MVAPARAPAADAPEEEGAPARVAPPETPPLFAVDDSALIGSGDAEEAALLAANQAADAEAGFSSPAPDSSDPGTPAESGDPLPPLADLVNRIPGPTRDLLEELFRAKFVAVRRIPHSALKP